MLRASGPQIDQHLTDKNENHLRIIMASIQILCNMYGCAGIQKNAPANICMIENLKYMNIRGLF